MQLTRNRLPTYHIPQRAKVSTAATQRSVWRCAVWLLACLSALATFAGGSTASGQEISREYPLKAAFLYQLGTYIRWPDSAIANGAKPGNGTSPFVIGVLGPDPVGAYLRKIAEKKRIAGRKIEVKSFQRAEQVRTCHILFMSRKTPRQTQEETLELLASRNILFVGETSDFLAQGGVIRFAIWNNQIRMYFSESACRREGLEVSAKIRPLLHEP